MSVNPSPQTSRIRKVVSAVQSAFHIVKAYPVLIPLGIVTLFSQVTYSGINNVGVPFYIKSLRLAREGQIIALITSTFLLAETFLRVPFGWISDRYGRVRVIVGAMLCSAPTVLASGLVPGYIWLIPLRGWDGMMAAALWPSIYALIGDRVPERLRANAMGVVNMMYMLALFIGVALGYAIFHATGHPRAFFSVGALIFLLGGIGAYLFFRRIPQLNVPHPEVHLEDAEQAVVSASRHIVLLTITFTQTLAITALAPYMMRYATDAVAEGGLGFNLSQLALLVGAPIIGVGLFAVPLSRLSDLLGKLTAVRISFTAIAIMLWIFARFHTLPVLAATAMVIGVAFSMGIPAWLAILSSLSGSKTRGVTLASYGTVQGLASVLGPQVTGWIWDHIGHGQIFLASAVSISVAAALTLFALPAETGGSKKIVEAV